MYLSEHDCVTVADMEWRGKRNGELLTAAEGQFDILLTADRGYEHQQNLSGRKISVIILSGRSNTFDALAPCMPICRECLKSISPGVVIRVTQP
jgi:hypothetical protein